MSTTRALISKWTISVGTATSRLPRHYVPSCTCHYYLRYTARAYPPQYILLATLPTPDQHCRARCQLGTCSANTWCVQQKTSTDVPFVCPMCKATCKRLRNPPHNDSCAAALPNGIERSLRRVAAEGIYGTTDSLLYGFPVVRILCCTDSLLYGFPAVRIPCCTDSLLYGSPAAQISISASFLQYGYHEPRTYVYLPHLWIQRPVHPYMHPSVHPPTQPVCHSPGTKLQSNWVICCKLQHKLQMY